ncbi:hypothetical protein [Hoylesella timonensis]
MAKIKLYIAKAQSNNSGSNGAGGSGSSSKGYSVSKEVSCLKSHSQPYYIFILLLFLLYVPKAWAQHLTTAEQIRLFYDRYMVYFEEWNNNKLFDLQSKFLTPEMLEKKGRLANATDSDPILRAQDVSEYGRQSLTCRHLEGDWYEVTYRWDAQDTTAIHIPVRVEEDEKGQVRINYITPEWGGSRYGNYLFDIPAPKVTDRKDARTFVETFFKAYTYPYVKMSHTLEQDLEQLRKRYCTSSFLTGKYTAIKQEYMKDYEDIDPLVDCADFDTFWYPSIKIDSIDSHTFRFGYDTCVKGWHQDIKVVVTRKNGRFLISDIEAE